MFTGDYKYIGLETLVRWARFDPINGPASGFLIVRGTLTGRQSRVDNRRERFFSEEI